MSVKKKNWFLILGLVGVTETEQKNLSVVVWKTSDFVVLLKM